MDPNNFFDIWGIYSNEIIGDVMLTIIISLLLLLWFSSKGRLPFQVTFSLIILLMAVMSVITLHPAVYIFTVLASGIFFYYIIASKIRKG